MRSGMGIAERGNKKNQYQLYERKSRRLIIEVEDQWELASRPSCNRKKWRSRNRAESAVIEESGEARAARRPRCADQGEMRRAGRRGADEPLAGPWHEPLAVLVVSPRVRICQDRSRRPAPGQSWRRTKYIALDDRAQPAILSGPRARTREQNSCCRSRDHELIASGTKASARPPRTSPPPGRRRPAPCSRILWAMRRPQGPRAFALARTGSSASPGSSSCSES